MAEKRFLKGLFKDTGHLDQPEGTWRYAKNATLNSNKGTISNEKGNIPTDQIDEGYRVLGAIPISDERVILFLKHKSNIQLGPIEPEDTHCEIGVFFNDKYTTLFNNKDKFDLNFNLNNPIEGTFKVDAKGDLVVYWVDDLNPPRAFNVSRQERALALNPNYTILYGITYPTNVKTHLGLLNLFPSSGMIPAFSNTVILPGGALLSGVYYLALAYVDEDLVATNYLTVSDPVSIIEESMKTRPTVKIDGLRAGSQTSKSITWNIKNLNRDYRYIRAAVIRKKGDTVEVFRLNDLTMPEIDSTRVNFSGTESVSPGSLEEVLIDTVGYESAKTINQLDGVMYIGNLKGSKDVGFQKYANAIRVDSTVKVINKFDQYFATVDGLESGFNNTTIDAGAEVDSFRSYRDPELNSKFRGYLRDETYAFYVAFILNDGSMSYAYHIPGREQLYTQERDPIGTTGGVMNEANLDLDNARQFHLRDFSDPNVEATYINSNSLSDPASQMNYWDNHSEEYPDTDDYDVFKINGDLDPVTGLITNPEIATQLSGNPLTLRNKNVRHHHMPSNDNWFRKSIGSGHNSTAVTATVSTEEYNTNVNVTGTYEFKRNTNSGSAYHTITGSTGGHAKWSNDSMATSAGGEGWGEAMKWQDVTLTNLADSNVTDINVFSNTSNVNNVAMTGLYDGQTGIFVANQDMLIDNMSFKSWYKRDNNDTVFSTFKTRIAIKKVATDETYYTEADHDVSNDNWGVSGYPTQGFGTHIYDYNQKSGINLMYPESTSGGTVDGTGVPIQLTNGDRMWVESRAFNNDANSIRQAKTSEMEGSDYGYWKFDIDTDPITDFTTAGTDIKLSQNVYILGVHLANLKIPRSIADKVQGFRVYRAKRDHKNKTILGQSVVLPMSKTAATIGVCQEASLTAGSSNVLNELSGENEIFYKANPWADASNTYGSTGYTHFTFHDFNLLRTKSSLAGATHIKPIYMVNNLAWNGPTLRQDKKMMTTIVSSPDNAPDVLKEHWGYDADFNCYTEEVESAIFMGLEYVFNVQLTNVGTDVEAYRYPRMLAQKAKTYLLGDSIFEGESLGFGAKIFNEHGESCIALALQNNQGLPAVTCDKEGSTHASGDHSDCFGHSHPDAPSWLVNSGLPAAIIGGSESTIIANSRYFNYMVNLHAHKVDLYKSIDSQELVWTGYEVLGKQNLKNYIFNDDPESDNYLQHIHAGNLPNNNLAAASLYSTIYGETYEAGKRSWTGGIFGGDTFIARHGFATSVTPSDSNTKSTPQRAIYYNIVESPDNINFRHSEDDNSLYFPNSPAKSVLKKVGPKDLTHVDNIKYNSNYSEDNDLRPAFPLPLREIKQTSFPTRTHRSVKADNTSLIDNYRVFLANQYKDLPKNRGDLWKLSSFNNLLYFHMEHSLFATKGKQTMEMKDGSEAFVGSGDIFTQPADEVLQTKLGYGGTQSQWAALTTRYGYFFVDKTSKKVFLMSDKLTEISALGLENWFDDNLAFSLEEYGLAPLDNPILGLGIHSTWDPIESRVLLTKNDLKPTYEFITGYNLGQDQSEEAPGAIWYNASINRFMITEELEILQSGIAPPTQWEVFSSQFANSNGVGSFGSFTVQSSVAFANGAVAGPSVIPYEIEGGYWIYPGQSFVLLTAEQLISPSATNVTVYIYPSEEEAPILIQDDPEWQMDNLTVYNTLGLQVQQGFNAYQYHLYYNPISSEVMNTRELLFSENLYFNQDGWTVSFYPEINAWGSFHSYLPYRYFSLFNSFYSLNNSAERLIGLLDTQVSTSGSYALEAIDQTIWKHLEGDYGKYYYSPSDFEFSWLSVDPYIAKTFEIEYIDNQRKVTDSIFASLSYTVDVVNSQKANVLDSGFTDFFVYNSKQLSLETELEYLINIRQSGNNWKINSFRDMSKLAIDTDAYYTPVGMNVAGVQSTGTLTNLKVAMFEQDGMHENINSSYLDIEKVWNLRKKFVDKWLGIRLISDNLRNNSVNLYSALTEARKYFR